MAADENYAMPLAAGVKSILSSLSPRQALRLFVLDSGITADSKQRLLRSWSDKRLTVEWLEPDLRRLDNLPISGHVTRTAYSRLLLPSVLPDDVSRVIYLDSDLIVLRDLAELWAEPLMGAACLAVTDAAAPRIDASVSLPNHAACQPYLAASQPIANFRELGLDPRAHYFNSGVLVIDLAKWRQEGIAEQTLHCLDVHRQHVLWWDQYALNVVLHGRWREPDVRWNQGAQLYRYPRQSASPFDPGSYSRLWRDPWIVHFTSPRKPWHFACDHPYQGRFLKFIDQTDWRGWRPETPYHNFAQWIEYHYGRYRQWRKRLRSERKKNKHRDAARRAA
jgi:lipopolysaccharide biosynthesis glycosyltransferase